MEGEKLNCCSVINSFNLQNKWGRKRKCFLFFSVSTGCNIKWVIVVQLDSFILQWHTESAGAVIFIWIILKLHSEGKTMTCLKSLTASSSSWVPVKSCNLHQVRYFLSCINASLFFERIHQSKSWQCSYFLVLYPNYSHFSYKERQKNKFPYTR